MVNKEAMKLALEALKVSVPVILGNFSRHSKAIAALEALAEQPVAEDSSVAQAAKQPAQQEPVTDEENEKFSRDVSNFKGADPEATKHALEEFLRNRVPAIGDIRALKHRIHALEGDVIGYKQMLKAAEQQARQEPVAVGSLDSLKLSMQHSAWDGVIQLSDALKNIDDFAKEQPAQQEPVAHRDGFWCADLTCKKCYSADFRFKHRNSVFNESLTTPAQRTWVGLTDEQAHAMWSVAVRDAALPRSKHVLIIYKEAIEEAHGIGEKK